MAGSVNLVIIVGNVGKDPELKALPSGDRLANFSVATSEHWTDKASGEKKSKVEWHKIVCFNDRTCTVIEKYVRKGQKVYVEGQLQTRKWTSQDGADHYSTEIVIGRFNGKLEMLSKPAEATEPEDRAPAAGRSSQVKRPGGGDLDDELPFGPCWQ